LARPDLEFRGREPGTLLAFTLKQQGETVMKKTIKLFTLFAMLVLVAACAQRRNTTGQVGTGRNSRGGNYNGVYTGQATTSSNNMNAFVSNMANSDGSTYVLPCSVTSINMAATSGTALQQGSFDNQNGSLHLDLILGCTATDQNSGGAYSDIPIDIQQGNNGSTADISGWINGSSAVVDFTDGYGTIELNGTISGSTFSGTINYSNAFYYQNGQEVTPGANGQLGSFSINACSVFNCTGT
jgi:hypothetical protein